MQQTFKEQTDADMGSWFAELQRNKKTPSGIPQKVEIKTEVIKISKDELGAFLKNPEEFVSRKSSDNATNAISDPLFG